MGADCFCGCGREIKGVRPKANNAVAREMSDDLAVLRGALDNGDADDRSDQVRSLVARGADRLASMRGYLHEEIARGDLDKGATTTWRAEARKMCDSLLESSSGPAWEPDDPGTEKLAQSGTRAKGVITDVSRHGRGNERVASLEMSVSILQEGESRLDISRTLSIAVVKAPQIGDRIEVSYDPNDPDRFVYRPSIEL